MLPPHILVVEEVLPEVRKRMAISLYAEGLSQERISSFIGTSQAMVSRYLKEDGPSFPEVSKIAEGVARELTVAVLSGSDEREITLRFCRLMDAVIQSGQLDERYRNRFGKDPCRSCMGQIMDHTTGPSMLDDLSKAVNYLRSHPIPDLIPALKVNMAYGKEGSRNTDDIASFPGRLPDRRGRILEPSKAEFGASKHLASTLLVMMENHPSIRAVISIIFNDRVRDAIDRMGHDSLVLDRNEGDLKEQIKDIGDTVPKCVIDPGDFGIEPCLYLFGTSPLEVVSVIVDIQKEIGDQYEK